ncbi:MAG: sulfite exporter TauE/SafE family protein [Paracoccaceae bacterium]|nr:sulfite exporter TauE/SafE family protein [Paracoccaceae bacterium]
MDGLFFWTLATLSAVLVGMGKGGLPVVAMLSVPILSLAMSPVAAAGLLLPIYVCSDMFGMWAYRRDYDVRVMLLMAPGLALGIGLGWATAHYVSDDLVTALVGSIGAAFAASLLARKGAQVAAKQPKAFGGWFWGMVAGFTSFVSHAGGPPYQVYVLPLGLRKKVYAGTTTFLFAYVNILKLAPYWALGQINIANLKVAGLLMIPASCAVFLGVYLVKVIPEKLFFILIIWALLLLSLRLIWQGVVGLIA